MLMYVSESRRLRGLDELGVLDTEPERVFNQLTQLAAHLLNMPVCCVTLIDRDRTWVKSGFGTDIRSAPRELTFCNHVIRRKSVMVVADTAEDSRFMDEPRITNGGSIRFYAGAPICYKGANPGVFCVVDMKPRHDFGAREAAILQQFADITAEVLDLRKDTGLGERRQVYLD